MPENEFGLQQWDYVAETTSEASLALLEKFGGDDVMVLKETAAALVLPTATATAPPYFFALGLALAFSLFSLSSRCLAAAAALSSASYAALASCCSSSSSRASL